MKKKMNRKSVNRKLREFFIYHSDYEPKDNDNLIESGALDSFGIVEFLTFIEEQFNVQMDLEDIVRDNFSTLQKISFLIEKKQQN